MVKSSARIALATILIALLAAFFVFDLGAYLSLTALKGRHAELLVAYQAHPLRAILVYAGIYILVAALSLPGAAIMSLAGGALFGFWTGSVVVSISSAIGATCAFLIVRHLFRDLVQQRFGDQLRVINRGIEQDGAYYLLTLRLVSIFPFFIINILMALTPIRTSVFYGVSQLGMIPATLVFVNAGTQLARITSPADIFSPSLLFSFALLGLFPLLTKKTVDFIQRRRNSRSID